MENKIQILIILMVFVESPSFTKNQQRKEKKVMMSHAISILDISKLETRKLVRVYGHVVKEKLVKLSHVPKTDISLLNGLMKRQRNISLIDH